MKMLTTVSKEFTCFEYTGRYQMIKLFIKLKFYMRNNRLCNLYHRRWSKSRAKRTIS